MADDRLAVIGRCDGCEQAPGAVMYRVETATYRDGKPPTYSAVVWLCEVCHDADLRGAVEALERIARDGVRYDGSRGPLSGVAAQRVAREALNQLGGQ
jgi:hypothetical protein